MARCIIIGSSEQARGAAKQLQKRVLTKILVGKNLKNAVRICQKEHELEVIVIFFNDILGGDLEFIRMLREAVGPFVHIHVFKDANAAVNSTDGELNEVPVDEIFSSISLQPSAVVSVLENRWFHGERLPKLRRELTQGGAFVTRVEGGDASSVVLSPLEEAMSHPVLIRLESE